MRKIILLLAFAPLAFLQTRTSGAGTEPPAPPAPPFASVRALSSRCLSDLDASAKWYAQKLGLAVDMRTKSGKTSVIVLSGHGLTVELIRHDDALDLGKDPLLAHGFFKTGLVVDNLDRTLAGLRARNIQIAYGPYPR